MTSPKTSSSISATAPSSATLSTATLSSWDEYPVHQAPEFIRHPATSDRNFYDRYYFNLHGSTGEVFAIFGLGQYPNLGVTDAFVCVATPERHRFVRASRPLGDRMDVSVGPIRIEVLEPLRKLRVVCEPNDFNIDMDVVWESDIPAVEEPNQYLRSQGRVVFNTQRFAQLGTWSGSLSAGGESWEVTPDRWSGSRDRSWGVRPVGEPEADGIRQDTNVMAGMWNYFPIKFDDHAILYMCHEDNNGIRHIEEARRIWADKSRPTEHLGRPEFTHKLKSGTRILERSTIVMPDAPEGEIVMECTPLLANYISFGTGYGMEQDWRHGMYQGPKLVVQGDDLAVADVAGLGQYGVVDQVGKFTYKSSGANGNSAETTGYGLYEHGFFGPFHKLGLMDKVAVAD